MKEAFLESLLKKKNSARVSTDARSILKLSPDTQVAFEVCDKTHAIRMEEAFMDEYEANEEEEDVSSSKKPSLAHFELAYFDINS